MKRTIFYIGLALTLLILMQGGVWLWNSKATSISGRKETARATSRVSDSPPKLNKGVHLEDLSTDELRKLAANFESKKNHLITNFDTLVAEGETVITQGYESEPGSFVFTKMTPSITRNERASAVVSVKLETVKMTMSGQQFKLADVSVEMTGRTAGKPSHNVYFPSSDNTTHELQIFAEPDEFVPNMLKMSVKEKNLN
ncbi:MAG: hypothetical protein IAE77_13825 [Prosthecobacter sp.]|uniref:hypothetical protein n=1 Tax=Prosthecobacter sp. TaxID=1965333 RepID=UPI0019FAC6AE|nr:hypothetical protein [Prosthecobacter sp.]MBE2284530.1 hypothetical protein [Prosthecobacter sp.]